MDATDTTTPLQTLSSGDKDALGLAIRWVHPSSEGPVTLLDAGRILLGRGEKSRTRLSGEGVSRYHAEIRGAAGGPRIRDLDSTNGVHVNGARVIESELHVRDVVRLGACVGIVVEQEAPTPQGWVAFGEPVPGVLSGPVFNATLVAAQAAARTDLPVIVEGETGTGKERVARAIHAWSERSGAFVAINCAALPESLAEAELFGYRKGAFTGADRPSQGHFRAAHGGTLLLDEVVDLPLSLQAKVLRALEMREVVPLGETRPVPVDVRVLSAAQFSLEHVVEQRRFRADLLARLDGVTIHLPPLRQRIQEVPFLFDRLASRHGPVPSLDPRFVEALCRHDWPFNVREVELLSRRVMALHGTQAKLRQEHLPERLLPGQGIPGNGRREGGESPRRDARPTPADDARDLEALTVALRECRGNVTRAAALAGISRPRAYRLMAGRGNVDLDAIRSGKKE